jgi:hypothetical protein
VKLDGKELEEMVKWCGPEEMSRGLRDMSLQDLKVYMRM